MDYTLQLDTISGIGDSDYLDRLADVLYELDDLLIDPLLGLNDDGSISASFCVVGPNPLAAAQRAVGAFADAVAKAGPLRVPTPNEEARGQAALSELDTLSRSLASFTVAQARDHEAAVA